MRRRARDWRSCMCTQAPGERKRSSPLDELSARLDAELLLVERTANTQVTTNVLDIASGKVRALLYRRCVTQSARRSDAQEQRHRSPTVQQKCCRHSVLVGPPAPCASSWHR